MSRNPFTLAAVVALLVFSLLSSAEFGLNSQDLGCAFAIPTRQSSCYASNASGCSTCAGQSTCCLDENTSNFGTCEDNNLICPNGNNPLCSGGNCPSGLSCKYISCSTSSSPTTNPAGGSAVSGTNSTDFGSDSTGYCWGSTVCSDDDSCASLKGLFCRGDASTTDFSTCCSFREDFIVVANPFGSKSSFSGAALHITGGISSFSGTMSFSPQAVLGSERDITIDATVNSNRGINSETMTRNRYDSELMVLTPDRQPLVKSNKFYNALEMSNRDGANRETNYNRLSDRDNAGYRMEQMREPESTEKNYIVVENRHTKECRKPRQGEGNNDDSADANEAASYYKMIKSILRPSEKAQETSQNPTENLLSAPSRNPSVRPSLNVPLTSPSSNPNAPSSPLSPLFSSPSSFSGYGKNSPPNYGFGDSFSKSKGMTNERT